MSLTDKWIKLLDVEFRAHKAQLLTFDNTVQMPPVIEGGYIQKLVWKAPDTNVYAIQYLWDPQVNCLFVTGDMYAGVYRWYSKFDLASIANTNLAYFASKCEASGYGTDGQGRKWFTEELIEFCTPNHYEEYKGLIDGLCERFNCKPLELATAITSSWECATQEAWIDLLNDLDAEICRYNDYSDLGMHASLSTVAHWYGLKCATKQLNKTC